MKKVTDTILREAKQYKHYSDGRLEVFCPTLFKELNLKLKRYHQDTIMIEGEEAVFKTYPSQYWWLGHYFDKIDKQNQALIHCIDEF